MSSHYAAVAARYARALFELAEEGGALDDVVPKLRDFAEVYAGNAELVALLDNPMVDADKRAAVLDAVCSRVGLSGFAANTVRLLASRHRLRALPEIAAKLASLADRQAGVLRASVVSAVPLPEAFYSKLESTLSGATQRKVVLQRELDPSLIAGVVTRFGDNTIDGSIKGRLAEIERQIRSV